MVKVYIFNKSNNTESRKRVFCSGATSSAKTGTVSAACTIAKADSRVSEAAAGAQAAVPETADEPVSASRWHGVLRV